jgi:hypothetical protein
MSGVAVPSSLLPEKQEGACLLFSPLVVNYGRMRYKTVIGSSKDHGSVFVSPQSCEAHNRTLECFGIGLSDDKPQVRNRIAASRSLHYQRISAAH